jgi:geranylgeranyl pyrophosphate synthase
MKDSLLHYQQRVNNSLENLLAKHHQGYEKELAEAVKYATLNNGKRLRPALIYGFAEALNIPLDKVDSSAMAIELIHSYSLVHDDLPAMDNDVLRRGVPTCHIKYSEATAILVGDAQQTLAYEAIANDPKISDKNKIKLIQLVSEASGLKGMIGGQYTDIQSEGQSISKNTLQNMHRMKTGALIKAAVLMGSCQHTEYKTLQTALIKFADHIGLAFQVHDDILDIESNTETLGKPVNSDVDNNKATYPKIMGVEQAKYYRDQLINDALTELDNNNIKSDFLRKLTSYISQRLK